MDTSPEKRHLSDYESRIPDQVHRAERRCDVYYDPDWERDGRHLGMKSRAELKAESKRARHGQELSREQAGDRLVSSPENLASLRSVKDWRRSTIEQQGTILGSTALQPLPCRGDRRWSELPTFVRDGFVVELVNRSTRPDMPIVLEATNGAGAAAFLNRLNSQQLWNLTQRTGWTGPGGGPVHDAWATEFLIRIAEFSPWVTAVLAEGGASYWDLSAQTCGHKSFGDGRMSRSDGLQVIFELTCTVGDPAKIRAKVDTAIKLILSNKAVAVLFVEAPRPGYPDARVWNPLRNIVGAAFGDLCEKNQVEVQDRLGLARWRWYWPESHMMTDQALWLTAICPTGRSDNSWNKVNFLDPDSLVLPAEARQIGRHWSAVAAASASIPHWLKSAGATK